MMNNFNLHIGQPYELGYEQYPSQEGMCLNQM